ncbi:MAG: hypothetical protein HY951_15475 [Bacteroidia bacterium]|nr:hypothetical protein [Bacteroidia bacterium]
MARSKYPSKEYKNRIEVNKNKYNEFNKYQKRLNRLSDKINKNIELSKKCNEILIIINGIDIEKSDINGIEIDELNSNIQGLEYLVKKYNKIQRTLSDSAFQINYNGLINNIINICRHIQLGKKLNGCISYPIFNLTASSDNTLLYNDMNLNNQIQRTSLVEVHSLKDNKLLTGYWAHYSLPSFGRKIKIEHFTSKTTSRRNFISGCTYIYWLSIDTDGDNIVSNKIVRTLDWTDTNKCDNMPCQYIDIDIIK